MRWVAIVVLGIVAGTACTERIQLTPEPLPGLVALRIEPARQVLELSELGGPARRIDYTAVGSFLDGSERDVSDRVAWTTDTTAAGSIDARGTFSTTNVAGGRIEIRASSGSQAGRAELAIRIDARIIDSASPPPTSADAVFPPAAAIIEADPTRAPSVRYPSHDTMFPQGLASTLFQHARGAMNDAVRLTFTSDYLRLEVITGSDRWQADAAAWSAIAHTHAGSSVRLVVDAADSTMPGTIYRGTAATLRFARGPAEGAIYYFSDTTDGVLRGRVSSTLPTSVLPTSGTRCVGCHAISRDGRTIAFGHGGETLATYEVETGDEPIGADANIGMGWATFSPDGTQLLVADGGRLELRDAGTGELLERVDLGRPATHPDWSPDGTRIAVSLADTVSNMELKGGGSIAVVPHTNGVWGEPTVVVASTGASDNNYFPRWSPDGRYLAYVNAAGTSKDAKTAELRLVAATGGPPLRLAIASHRVGAVDGVPDLATTMPSWGPSMEGSVAWLAFASRRPYGVVRPATGTSQIWIAAVDLERREDPSYAAFWFLAQDITQLANGPVWAVLPTAAERSR